jgi:hypothetical protein
VAEFECGFMHELSCGFADAWARLERT